jgi:TonB-linked SusC/RagA family outer membrane protein
MKRTKFFKLINKLVSLLILIFILPIYAIAQNPGEVKGIVKSDAGFLAGATVTLKEDAKVSAFTDSYGNYIIKVPNNGTLVFTLVGYRSLEVPVKTKSIIDVNLVIEYGSMNDVVVVGYGKQKKTSLTAAVSTMDGKTISSLPITNISNTLGGRLSGVISKQGSGEPGLDQSSIYIRGVSSIGANQPLIVVDGIPRTYSLIDPNGIETVTVLKDAAAVAPYGVAGANGVILITTKRGKSGSPKLTYNGYVSIQNPTILPDFVNAVQYATLRNSASDNDGLPHRFSDADIQKYKDGLDPDLYANSNANKELQEINTLLTSHNFEISGGSDKIKYYANIGFLGNEGIYKTTYEKRFNLDLKLDAQVTNTTKLSISIIGAQRGNNYSAYGSARNSYFAQTALPIRPIRYQNGLNADFPYGTINGSGYRKLEATQLFTQLSLEQELPFIKGLNFKGTLAFDPRFELNKTWLTPVEIWSLDATQSPRVYNKVIYGPSKPQLTQSSGYAKQLTTQAGLNYSRNFGKHNLAALALFESRETNDKYFDATRMNYNLYLPQLSLGSSAQADISNSGYETDTRQMGLVYRIAYNYNAKYLFEVSARNDGSYYFAPDKRWGFFPAFSIGWRLSEEKFIKDNLTWVDNLKIRASVGETGALAGAPFQYLNAYNVYGPASSIAGVGTQGVRTTIEANPSITWERAKKTDIGLEASIFKGLLKFEVDYFYEKRSNMLVSPDVVVPVEYGIGLSQTNEGIMENKGIDLSISSFHRVNKDLDISLTANFTYAKNNLLQVFETKATYDNPNRRITGRPLGTIFGYQDLGYYQVSDFEANGSLKSGLPVPPSGSVKPGDIKYADMNKDGKIDINDYTVIGNGTSQVPQIIYGFSTKIRYKSFDLDLFFQGAAKTSFYGDGTYNWPFFNNANAFVDNFDYWTPTNTNAKFPRITNTMSSSNSLRSSHWLHDASYLRLKSAIISYTLPVRISQKLKMENLRIYVSGQNLLTFTKIRNYDPENINSNGNGYPQQRVISFGLNVTF